MLITVAANKMDTIDSDEEYSKFVQEYREQLSKLIKVHSIVPISCYTGQGLDQLQNLLFEMKYGKERMREEDISWHGFIDRINKGFNEECEMIRNDA